MEDEPKYLGILINQFILSNFSYIHNYSSSRYYGNFRRQHQLFWNFWRRPQLFWKWKTTSKFWKWKTTSKFWKLKTTSIIWKWKRTLIFWKMEDDLNLLKNGSWPHFGDKWKATLIVCHHFFSLVYYYVNAQQYLDKLSKQKIINILFKYWTRYHQKKFLAILCVFPFIFATLTVSVSSFGFLWQCFIYIKGFALKFSRFQSFTIHAHSLVSVSSISIPICWSNITRIFIWISLTMLYLH